MPNKLSGTAIQSGTITSTQLSATLTTTIESGGGPKIASIIYPGDDTAANTNGGQTLYITGSGFKSNSTVYINGNNVPSVSYISASNLSFTGPALSSASYPVYVINPEDGATAILIPGLQVSGEPSWVTDATLSEQDAAGAWNISLSATGDAPLTYALAAGSSLPTGISLASNGVISGTITTPPEADTTYNFTVVATDAQNQDSSRAFSVTAKTGEGLLFANNVLLIHADGTNNQNNHTFLDSSNNNFTITRYGNASQGSYSPHSQTGWSNYFDGSGDYFAASNQISNFGTGDFTIECWVYKTGTTSVVLSNQDGGTDANYFVLDAINANVTFQIRDNSSQAYAYGPAMANNTWTHIAVTRSSNSVKVFVNGVSGDAVTISKSVTSRQFLIGAFLYTGFETYFGGYISNVRVVKGTALYTSNFTPSTTPLQPVTNTSILTCQSNRFVDEGPNNYTLTRNGDISVQPFGPFAPVITTANSNSVYFDGSGDYLTTASDAAFGFGTGDFTIEGWIYTNSSSTQRIISSSENNGELLLVNSGGNVYLNWFDGSSDFGNSSNFVPQNSWAHVAVTRSSGSVRLFINGTLSNTPATSTRSYGTRSVTVGIYGGDNSTQPFNGSISNLRILKGTALYTSSFTVPTSPLTAISNTSLLTCQSTTFIDNSTNALAITPSGNVRPRSFNPFGYVNTASAYSTANVGGSAYFDGSGDYLSAPDSTAYDFGTGDFTVEAWIYPTTASGVRILVGQYSGSDGFSLELTNTNTLTVWLEGSTIATSSGTVIANAWNHVAVSRSGSSLRLFINGAVDGTATNSTNISGSSSALYISSSASTPGAGVFTGYMSGVRVVKGTAVYTGAFALPSAPPTNIANTSLLLNFTNAGIFDQTAKNVIETVGDAKVSTAQFKYGSASMYFDGTGDYLTIPDSQSFNFGSGDFTIEMWIYFNAFSDGKAIITKGWSTVNAPFLIYTDGVQNKVKFYSSSNGSTWNIADGIAVLNSPSTGQWYHIAVTRSGSTFRTFANGTETANVTSSAAVYSTTQPVTIGSGTGSTSINAYIDDLRITKGYARYTSNFTAPTSALKDK
jgi:hypothetical protein